LLGEGCNTSASDPEDQSGPRLEIGIASDEDLPAKKQGDQSRLQVQPTACQTGEQAHQKFAGILKPFSVCFLKGTPQKTTTSALDSTLLTRASAN